MGLRKNWNYTLRSRRRLRAAERFLFLLPSLGGASCFVMLPFGKMVVSSFFTVLTNDFAGFRNYAAVFRNEAFRLAGAIRLGSLPWGSRCFCWAVWGLR